MRLCFGQPCSPTRNGRFARPCDHSAYTYTPSGRSPARLVSFSQVPPGCGPKQSRAWHPREFGAVLGGSASLPLPAPPLPSSSRRYAPQCFVGEYASSPCDVSHRASDEPRRCMSLSSALAPSSLASPSIRRVFLRSFCARRRSVAELICRDNCTATLSDSNSTPTDINYFANDFVRAIISFGDTSAASGFLQISPHHPGRFCDIMFTSCECGAMAQRGEIQCAESQFALQSSRLVEREKFRKAILSRESAYALPLFVFLTRLLTASPEIRTRGFFCSSAEWRALKVRQFLGAFVMNL